MKFAVPLTVAGLILLCSARASAQDPQSRAEQLREEREAKQKVLAPPTLSPLQSAMLVADTRVVPILQRDGLYAKLGSLTTSSGFAYGLGYRDRALVDGQGGLDLWAAGSIKGYWALNAQGSYPLRPGGAFSVHGSAKRQSYPEEEYFGLGPDSKREAFGAYAFNNTSVSGGLHGRFSSVVRAGGDVEYLRPRVGPGESDEHPPIDILFPPIEREGFEIRTSFVRTAAFASIDYRQPLNARKGGYYRVDVNRYDDQSGDAYSFTRVEMDLRQYVSFLAERRVLVGRAWVSTSETDDLATVPFYMMPSLGGNSTLRGFRANRFRAPHAMLLQAEYRWEIWSGLEAALFYDTGKVAMERKHLDFHDLEKDYGFGFRFNTDQGIIFRVDAAFGSRDGKQLHIVFGGLF